MSTHGDGGKGDTPRPIVDRKQFESNWETIFNKKVTDEPFKDEPLKETDND